MPSEGIYWMELLKTLYIPMFFVLPFVLYGVAKVTVTHIAERNRKHRQGVEESAVDQPLSW